MYVCICNAVKDSDIEAAVSTGVRSLAQLRERLNVSGCCGLCADQAEECLSRYTGEPPVRSPLLAAATA